MIRSEHYLTYKSNYEELNTALQSNQKLVRNTPSNKVMLGEQTTASLQYPKVIPVSRTRYKLPLIPGLAGHATALNLLL